MESIIQSFAKCQNTNELDDIVQQVKEKEKDFVSCMQNIFQIIQHKYHTEGNSPWDDRTYDLLLELLTDKYQLNLEKQVGSNISSAVTLPFYMGSMNKIKTIKHIENWKKKYKAPYLFSAKLDGISAMFVNNTHLYTRGNGTHGRDISYLIPFLNIETKKNIGIRGELIISKKVFKEKYKSSYSNARNLVCGLVNRNFDVNMSEYYQDIEFIAYDIYRSQETKNYIEKFNELQEMGFQVVSHCISPKCMKQNCDDVLKQWKQESLYEIDGIIITNHEVHFHEKETNPEFAFAYKNNEICINTSVGVVDKVIWNISKDNYIKPTIHLETPIICDQSKVEYVTGFNAKYIIDNHICKGSKLEIGLSGNVIPHIFKVFSNEDFEEDVLSSIDCSYTWTKNHVDLVCSDETNCSRVIKQNLMFFNTLGLKCNLQEKTLWNVYHSLGVYLLRDILSLSLDDWIKVEKMGEKKANGILGAIYDSMHWPEIAHKHNQYTYFIHLAVGLQTFERGFAYKKIDLYVSYLCSLDHSVFSKFYDNNHIDSVTHYILSNMNDKKQITEATMRLFLQGFKKMNQKMEELACAPLPFILVNMKTLLDRVLKDSKKSETSGVASGHEFVFSGFRNETWRKAILANGAKVMDQVSRKTRVLVAKKESSKTKKASELGIFIWPMDSFLELWEKEYKDKLIM